MRITNISEAKASLSKLVAEVEGGSEVILGRAGRPVAKIVKFDPSQEPRDLSVGTWRGRVWIAQDFDELPADFLAHFTAGGQDDG
ncbi:MAG: type II toxin-antitoxin system prevent-host-death family antitoxin [Trueperaceae bacterium]|nr:type II toxin-antitoxin system prevent-host-death family antitoxin [Trueperaceae bacterium]